MTKYLIPQSEKTTAVYRVLLKRILRSTGQTVDNEATTESLQVMLYNVAHAVPKMVADKIDSRWNAAAKAWEDGNNSGNSRILSEKEIECDEIREAAIRLMREVFNAETDFPGLYPSFKVKGFCEYSTLNAIKAALVKE